MTNHQLYEDRSFGALARKEAIKIDGVKLKEIEKLKWQGNILAEDGKYI